MKSLQESLLDDEDILMDNTDMNISEPPKLKNNVEILIFIKAMYDNAKNLSENYKNVKVKPINIKTLITLFKKWAPAYSAVIELNAHDFMCGTFDNEMKTLKYWTDNLVELSNKEKEDYINTLDYIYNLKNTNSLFFYISICTNIWYRKNDLPINNSNNRTLIDYITGVFNYGDCTSNWSSSEKRKLQEYHKLIGKQIQKAISSYKIIH